MAVEMALKVGIASALLKSKFLWLYTWEKYAEYIEICLKKDDQNVQTSYGGPPSLLFSGYRGCFPGVKWPGREPLFSAEINNEWGYTSNHQTCLHGIDSVNFTLTLISNMTMCRFISACWWTHSFLPSVLFLAFFLPSQSLHHCFCKQTSVK